MTKRESDPKELERLRERLNSPEAVAELEQAMGHIDVIVARCRSFRLGPNSRMWKRHITDFSRGK